MSTESLTWVGTYFLRDLAAPFVSDMVDMNVSHSARSVVHCSGVRTLSSGKGGNGLTSEAAAETDGVSNVVFMTMALVSCLC